MMKRRMITICLSSTLLLSSLFAPIYGEVYYQENEIQQIASGVTYESVLKYTDQGWHNINVCRIDLNNKDVDLNVIGSTNGIATKQSLTSMMEQLDEPVVGINGDYFNMMKTDSPIGLMVNQGELVSSSVLEKPYNAFVMSEDGKSYFGTFNKSMTLTTTGNKELVVRAFNKITWKYHMITVLDKNWGAMSPGVSNDYTDLIEIVVLDSVVKEKRIGKPATKIPEEGYILLASGTNGQLLNSELHIGDKLNLDLNLEVDGKDIVTAIGGGSLLLTNGKIAGFSESINGMHPRSALGLNKDGNELMMVTIDGRHQSYKGIDGSGMAELMLELGSYNAMILDGGGSTTMALRELGDEEVSLVNHPSDGSQRRIINSLVISSKSKTNDLEGLLIESENEDLLLNIATSISLKAYDTTYHPMKIETNDIKYRIKKGKATISDDQLTPLKSGVLIVEANYKGKKILKEFNVIGEPLAIAIEIPKYNVDPNQYIDLKVVGVDKQGFRAPIDMEQIQFLDSEGLGNVENGSYKAYEKQGLTTLTAKYKKLETSSNIAVGSKLIPVGSFEKYMTRFVSYPESVRGKVSVVDGGYLNTKTIKMDFELTGTIGTAAAYTALGYEGITIPEGANAMSLWVKSDTVNPHWIKGKIKDAKGETFLVDIKKGIDWTGWENISAELPYDMTAPAKLERLYIVETEESKKTNGSLYFDGLIFAKPYEIDQVKQNSKGQIVLDDAMKTITDYDSKWLVYGGRDSNAFFEIMNKGYNMGFVTNAYFNVAGGSWMTPIHKAEQRYKHLVQDDNLMILLDDHNDGLRKSDSTQWTWLSRLLESSKSKSVHLFFSKPIWGSNGFSDIMEAQLLGDKLEALTANDVKVNVFFGGGSHEVELRNGVRYIGIGSESNEIVTIYNKDDETYFSLDLIE